MRRALHLALAALLLSGAPAHAAALFAGPPSDIGFTAIAAELSGALWSDRQLSPTPVADTRAALAALEDDPESLAVAEQALVLDVAARPGGAPGRLDFIELAGQRCLVVFALKGGWVHSFADLAGSDRGAASIGAVGPNAGAMLSMLQRFDPELAGLEVQQGTAEDLAARVARGTLDALLVAATFGAPDRLTTRLAGDDRLIRMAPVTRQITRAATRAEGGMNLAQMRIDRSSVIAWPRAPEVMLCTPLGVALRSDAPRALKSSVMLVRPTVVANMRVSTADRATTEMRDALDDATETVRRFLKGF